MTTKGTIEFDDGDIYSIVLDDGDSLKAIHHLWDMIERDKAKKICLAMPSRTICPSCKKVWITGANNNFCRFCGQRLDWSEDET